MIIGAEAAEFTAETLIETLPKSLEEKCTESVACDVAEWRNSHGIVPAWERKALERHAIAADGGEKFVG